MTVDEGGGDISFVVLQYGLPIMVFVLFVRVAAVLGVGLWGNRQMRGARPGCPLFLGPRPDLDLD